VTENTKRGARGFVLAAASLAGNPAENSLLPTTATELEALGLHPRELVGDGGFQTAPTLEALPGLAPAPSSYRAATSPAPDAPASDERATARGSRAASATSNAATG